jgi:dTMP kinase
MSASERVRGRLIAFEGGEASGKSTQARVLAVSLGAVLTREPGGTDIGRRIRAVVLARDLGALDARAEALLMAADRAQHVTEVIEPALARGDDVVTDRFSGSSLAYQGFGRGLDVDEVRRLSAWAAAGVEPDLIVLLDVPVDVAAGRRGAAGDRMEAEGSEFHARVLEGYRALAVADPHRWVVVDGAGSVDDVGERVAKTVAERLQPRA